MSWRVAGIDGTAIKASPNAANNLASAVFFLSMSFGAGPRAMMDLTFFSGSNTREGEPERSLIVLFCLGDVGAPDIGILGTPCRFVVGGLLPEALCIAVVRRLMERAPLRARFASCFLPVLLLVLLLLLLGLRPKRLRAVTATVPALLVVEAQNAAVATSRVHGHSPPRDALGRRARQTVDEHVPHCRLGFLESEVALAEIDLPNVVVVRGDRVQDDVI